MGAVAAAAGAAPGLRGRAGQVLEVLPDLEGVIARGSPAQPRLPGKWKRRSLGGPRVGSQGSQARGLGGRANARRRAGPPGVLSFQGFGPFGEHTVNASWIAVQFVNGTEGQGPGTLQMGACPRPCLLTRSPESQTKRNSVFLKTCVSGFVQISDRSLHGAEWTQSRVSEFLGPRHCDLHLNRRKIN
ncbi:pyroglutamyl-peptidase 1 isoform X4 [Macaca mulatta]